MEGESVREGKIDGDEFNAGFHQSADHFDVSGQTIQAENDEGRGQDAAEPQGFG